jgi:2-polyprenyl-3-methyl-5-hydroxy-6-metoxy-1,4-benzoquinol methylase
MNHRLELQFKRLLAWLGFGALVAHAFLGLIVSTKLTGSLPLGLEGLYFFPFIGWLIALYFAGSQWEFAKFYTGRTLLAIGGVLLLSLLPYFAFYLIRRMPEAAMWLAVSSLTVDTTVFGALLMRYWKGEAKDQAGALSSASDLLNHVLIDPFRLKSGFVDRSLQGYHKDVDSGRKRMYADLEPIKAFQKCLTCSKVEARWFAEKVFKYRPELSELRILDVGGGDGILMRDFLLALKTKFPSDSTVKITIDVVEPAQFEAIYRQNLSQFIGLIEINFIQARFDKAFGRNPYIQEMQWDVVMFSHSLYAPLDNPEENWDMEAIAIAITNLVMPNGMLYISMVSRHSASYLFKNKIREELYPVPIRDASFEEYFSPRGLLSSLSNFLGKNNKESEEFDSVILVSDLMPGNEKIASMALQYFLRLNLEKDPRATMLSRIYLTEFSLPWESLAGHTKNELQMLYPEIFHDSYNELVLLHKTEALLMHKI